MTWKVHPASEDWRKLITAVVIIIPVLSWLWFSIGLFWAVLGLLLIFLSLVSFFLPTEYSIGDQEIRIKKLIYTQYRPIGEFKKIYILENGILFSPFRKKTFLNNFRGIFMLLPRDRDAIISYLKGRFGDLIADSSQDDQS
ncbi:MAG TPA: hypothetical protein EYP58_04585 [bacterium (Candidatus Stahlbacteria)]|nr:hypothetical protein [Candidatus Stahlbacteria bacterium]